jgi:outer membrane murein-binding lipoprotein Lpp
MSIFKKNTYFRVISLILFTLSISGCISLEQQQSTLSRLNAKASSLQNQVDAMKQKAINNNFDSEIMGKINNLENSLKNVNDGIEDLAWTYRKLRSSSLNYGGYREEVHMQVEDIDQQLTSISSLIATDPSLRMGL